MCWEVHLWEIIYLNISFFHSQMSLIIWLSNSKLEILLFQKFKSLHLSLLTSRFKQTFFSKGLDILGFRGHNFFVKTLQFCHCSTKVAIDNTPMGYSFPLSVLNQKSEAMIFPSNLYENCILFGNMTYLS